MSRRALRPYNGSTRTRRALSFKLPPKLARFCRNVFAGVMSVMGPYCAVLTVLICARAMGWIE